MLTPPDCCLRHRPMLPKLPTACNAYMPSSSRLEWPLSIAATLTPPGLCAQPRWAELGAPPRARPWDPGVVTRSTWRTPAGRSARGVFYSVCDTVCAEYSQGSASIESLCDVLCTALPLLRSHSPHTALLCCVRGASMPLWPLWPLCLLLALPTLAGTQQCLCIARTHPFFPTL